MWSSGERRLRHVLLCFMQCYNEASILRGYTITMFGFDFRQGDTKQNLPADTGFGATYQLLSGWRGPSARLPLGRTSPRERID